MTRTARLTTTALLRWCPGCRRERRFERPGCEDHGPGCSELVCCSCSAGLEV